VLYGILGLKGLGKVFPGVNVSDRDKDWMTNYRGPDVTVFLADTKAISRDTHFVGGPDFAVEVLSEGDRSREKFPFYAKVGVRELLLVNRSPWELELYRLRGRSLRLAGKSALGKARTLRSQVSGLEFRLVPGKTRPQIGVVHPESGGRWLI
jgi:Uma2 family endonuclease